MLNNNYNYNFSAEDITSLKELLALHCGFSNYSEMRGFVQANAARGEDHTLEETPVLYVDLDGTLAEFKYADSMDTLYEQGYFLNLKPIDGVLAGIKEFMRRYPEIPVYVLSAYLGDSKYALQEKSMWLDRYFPELEDEHQLFVKCGEIKADVPLESENAFLLDDHSQNLLDWEKAGFKGIKLLNGINGEGKKWKGDRISSSLTPDVFAEKLYELLVK